MNAPRVTRTHALVIAAAGLCLLSAAALSEDPAPETPAYTSDNGLKMPERYREWVYLSTGFDMAYRADIRMGHHMFDNVFVNPASYREFQKTGTWPDKTMLVLEVRGARDQGSINKNGNYQDTQVMGLEVHLKDEKRFPGKWAFYVFPGRPVGRLLPQTEDCYSCHAAHAAVDTTFVQFYPTLLPIATSKGTLSAQYRAEEAVAVAPPAGAH